MGFVSGFNVSHANDEQQVKGIDLVEMGLWMRNWCNKHPTKLEPRAGSLSSRRFGAMRRRGSAESYITGCLK